MILEKRDGNVRTGFSVSGYVPVSGSCEHLGSIEGVEDFDQLSDC